MEPQENNIYLPFNGKNKKGEFFILIDHKTADVPIKFVRLAMPLI